MAQHPPPSLHPEMLGAELNQEGQSPGSRGRSPALDENSPVRFDLLKDRRSASKQHNEDQKQFEETAETGGANHVTAQPLAYPPPPESLQQHEHHHHVPHHPPPGHAPSPQGAEQFHHHRHPEQQQQQQQQHAPPQHLNALSHHGHLPHPHSHGVSPNRSPLPHSLAPLQHQPPPTHANNHLEPLHSHVVGGGTSPTGGKSPFGGSSLSNSPHHSHAHSNSEGNSQLPSSESSPSHPPPPGHLHHAHHHPQPHHTVGPSSTSTVHGLAPLQPRVGISSKSTKSALPPIAGQ